MPRRPWMPRWRCWTTTRAARPWGRPPGAGRPGMPAPRSVRWRRWRAGCRRGGGRPASTAGQGVRRGGFGRLQGVADVAGDLAQNVLGQVEGRVGGWHPRIDGVLQQHLLELVGRQARGIGGGEGGAHVQLEFFPAAQRERHGQYHHAARLVRQARAAPDIVPRVAGDQVLVIGGEAGGPCQRAFDPGIAQHGAAVGQALFEIVFAAHGAFPQGGWRHARQKNGREDSRPSARTNLLQFTLMWLALTTSAQRASSAAMNWAKSTALEPTAVRPSLASLSRVSGRASAFCTISCSLATTSGGVPAGRKKPFHSATSKSAMPASATVGTSGSSGMRRAEETASALSLPPVT